MEDYIDLLKQILPELLVSHFDSTINKIKREISLALCEKNEAPQKLQHRLIKPKGFHKEIAFKVSH